MTIIYILAGVAIGATAVLVIEHLVNEVEASKIVARIKKAYTDLKGE